MDIPPPIPPVADPIDEKLLKRARHAGRNLSVLALLASLGAMLLIFASIYAKGIHGVMAVLAATITVIAAGYWVLAVAARRGNPNAVGVVIVVMVLQICLAVISYGVAAVRTNGAFQPSLGGLVIPILVVVALASSRKVLLDLKERHLWDQVFGSAKPSGGLCLIGGILLVAGFVAMNAGTQYVGWKAGKQQEVEFQYARAFVDLIQVEENEFMMAMQSIGADQGQNSIETAMTKLEALEKRFEVLNGEAGDVERLSRIFTTYGNALRQWRSGLLLLKDPTPDVVRAQKVFQLGDRLRIDACEEFDRRYAPKNPQQRI